MDMRKCVSGYERSSIMDTKLDSIMDAIIGIMDAIECYHGYGKTMLWIQKIGITDKKKLV